MPLNTVINKSSRVSKNNVPAKNNSNQASVSSESSQRGGLDNKKLVIGLLAIVCVVALAYLLLDFKNKGVKNQNENSAVSANSSVASAPAGNTQSAGGGAQLQVTSATDPVIAELVQTVFKHIFLPSGQVQIATVVKADELRKVNPVFYQFAKEGDKVLIYADRAILYDPVADKVLDVLHGSNQPVK